MHHRAGLARLLDAEGWDQARIDALLDGLERGATQSERWPDDATARERAVLDYAIVLSRDPAGMRPEHLVPMRAAGLDDGEILDANQVTAYFAYANRVVDGLGVELEPASPSSRSTPDV